MIRRPAGLAGLVWLFAATAIAQPPSEAPAPAAEDLPPGHPAPAEAPAPAAEDLPPGHPAPAEAPAPAAEDLPPGHPTPPAQAPAGPEAQGMPAGHPPSAVSPGQAVTPSAGEMRRLEDVLRPPASGRAEPSRDVPIGGIRVTVIDPTGRPVPDVAVDVGGLASGERSRFNGRTDASGVATFSDLPTGNGQAYRVNVPNEGATFSTSPFQLPTDQGFDVRILRYPVTRDPRFVFFHVFRVIAEQRGERMHVIHQAELSNAGDEAFVFGDDYADIELPEGYVNFRFQRVITDQRIEEEEGEGAYAIRGSLPPGTVRLAWAYELPIGETEMSIPVQIPLRFFSLQALAEAVPGLELSVRGMPNAERRDPHGEVCVDSTQTEGCAWVTLVRRGPTDPALRAITMRITGIPGPSPIRWIAVGVALLFLLGGALGFLMGPARSGRSVVEALERRRAALLREAEELEADFDAGEVGPTFRKQRREQIVRELAGVLHRLDHEGSADAPDDTKGSVWLGLGLGAVLGVLGLVVVGYRYNEPQTVRGVAVGFGLWSLALVFGAMILSF